MINRSLTICLVTITACIAISCGGGLFNEVVIGEQVWMRENLDVDTFRNGDPIPQAKTDEEWKIAGENGQPTWCYYENNPANGDRYGKLYNWYAVNDPRGLAPSGWHIPSDTEWTTLIDYLGGYAKAGTDMKSKNGWHEEGNGNNSSGFSGFPGGMRYYDGSYFFFIGKNGYWWSSSEKDTNSAWFRNLVYNSNSLDRLADEKQSGLSVRCIRD